MLYYMGGEECKIDATINDFYVYCWNYNINSTLVLNNLKTKFLYMTRTLIDLSIVWFEGVPESYDVDLEQWDALARQTG